MSENNRGRRAENSFNSKKLNHFHDKVRQTHDLGIKATPLVDAIRKTIVNAQKYQVTLTEEARKNIEQLVLLKKTKAEELKKIIESKNRANTQLVLTLSLMLSGIRNFLSKFLVK